jgi:hypothetical protein
MSEVHTSLAFVFPLISLPFSLPSSPPSTFSFALLFAYGPQHNLISEGNIELAGRSVVSQTSLGIVSGLCKHREPARYPRKI